MKLVVCHYHLNRGGVSRVIENHLRSLVALDANGRPDSVIVAYGGRATDWDFEWGERLPFDLEFVKIPALEYDAEKPGGDDKSLFSALQSMLTAHECHADTTIVHAHNHSLGKNAAFPAALARLAENGWRLLLQLHDFAEDLRPQNYTHLLEAAGDIDTLHARLYPQANHIHYASLNARDYEMLASAGVPSDRLHRLPNPVVSVRDATTTHGDAELRIAARQKLAATCDVPANEPYVLYPVRGIQRKNLGELLLWASLCTDTTFAVTLPPLNPTELKHYESWKAMAHDLSLPVLFEVGAKLTLAENYAAADAIITTSVAEGFGLVFLEAALMDRPLVGRNLPGITDDFSSVGIEFPGLVDSVNVPLSCIDTETFKRTFVEQTRKLHEAYKMPETDQDQLAASVDQLLFNADTIDFGRLDSVAQRHVLRRIHEQPELKNAIRELNPVIARVGGTQSTPEEAEILAANRQLIEQHYSLQTMGRKLQSIYGTLTVCNTSPVESRPAIAANLQQAFLRLEQMSPLRLEQ